MFWPEPLLRWPCNNSGWKDGCETRLEGCSAMGAMAPVRNRNKVA